MSEKQQHQESSEEELEREQSEAEKSDVSGDDDETPTHLKGRLPDQVIEMDTQGTQQNPRSDFVVSEPCPSPTVTRFIKIYSGKLFPKEELHGFKSFGEVFEHAYTNPTTIMGASPDDPLIEVLSLLKGKLREMAKTRRFKIANFTMGPQIGDGSFGVVYSANFETKRVALKQFFSNMEPVNIFKELHILIAVQHPRIVNLLGAFYDIGAFLVMDLCMGALRSYIGLLTLSQKIRFSIQLLEAIRHIHSKNVIHCDIKPDNCLITSNNNLVLSDFGNSQLLPYGIQFLKSTSASLALGSKGYCDVYANQCVYSMSTDIFAAGATIYELDTGYYLSQYGGWRAAPVSDYIRVVAEGRLLKSPPPAIPVKEGTPRAWDTSGPRQPLIDRCQSSRFKEVLVEMVLNSTDRMSAADLLEKYDTFWKNLLSSVKMKWSEIDDDKTGIEKLPSLVTQNRAFKPLQDIIDKQELIMHWMYYDKEIEKKARQQPVATISNIQPNFQTVSDNEVKCSAVNADDLRVAVNQLIQTKGFRIPKGAPKKIKAATSGVVQSVGKEGQGLSVPVPHNNPVYTDIVAAVIKSASLKNPTYEPIRVSDSFLAPPGKRSRSKQVTNTKQQASSESTAYPGSTTNSALNMPRGRKTSSKIATPERSGLTNEDSLKNKKRKTRDDRTSPAKNPRKETGLGPTNQSSVSEQSGSFMKPQGRKPFSKAYREKYHWPEDYSAKADWDGFFHCKYCQNKNRDYVIIKMCQKKCKKNMHNNR